MNGDNDRESRQRRLGAYFGGEKKAAAALPSPDPDSAIVVYREEKEFHPLRPDLAYDAETFSFAPEEIRSAESLIFLDVECLELGFGPNNTPYLIGLVEIGGGRARLTQIFSPTPLDEIEALEFLDDYWQKHDTIITYNGKSFDVPLIRNRFQYLARRFPRHFVNHFDIYRIIRRIHDFPRNRLSDMEKQILNLERVNDIGGAMSGQAYFEYLKHGSRDLLDRILEHNRIDLYSLASLAVHFSGLFTSANGILAGGDYDTAELPDLYRFSPRYATLQALQKLPYNRKKSEYWWHLAEALRRVKRPGAAARAYHMAYRLGLKKAVPAAIQWYLRSSQTGMARRLLDWALEREEWKIQEKLIKLSEKIDKSDGESRKRNGT